MAWGYLTPGGILSNKLPAELGPKKQSDLAHELLRYHGKSYSPLLLQQQRAVVNFLIDGMRKPLLRKLRR